MHYVLKGTNGNPYTKTTKKGSRQQKATLARYSFRLGFTIRSYRNVHKSQAKTSGRGQPGSTIIIFKEILRFNNNKNKNKNNNNNSNNHLNPFHGTDSPDKGLLLERASSPTSWGAVSYTHLTLPTILLV